MLVKSNANELKKLPLHEANKFQVRINIELGISEEIKVEFYSADRTDTSYRIYDGLGDFMGANRHTYVGKNPSKLNVPLVEDLNILLEAHGVSLTLTEFESITEEAALICENRYGRGNYDGDVIVTFM